MKTFCGNQFGRYIIIGLQKDDLILESVQKAVQEYGIKNAIVTSGIAAKCADNCMHCGKCEKILEQVLKYDVDHELRATALSFTNKGFLMAPKKRVPELIETPPGHK